MSHNETVQLNKSELEEVEESEVPEKLVRKVEEFEKSSMQT